MELFALIIGIIALLLNLTSRSTIAGLEQKIDGLEDRLKQLGESGEARTEGRETEPVTEEQPRDATINLDQGGPADSSVRQTVSESEESESGDTPTSQQPKKSDSEEERTPSPDHERDERRSTLPDTSDETGSNGVDPGEQVVSLYETLLDFTQDLLGIDEEVRQRESEGMLEWNIGAAWAAWIGGVAMIISLGFFVKYAYEHSLIGPGWRITLAYLASLGVGALGWYLYSHRYKLLSLVLIAIGHAGLYGATYSAHSLYEFIGPTPAFFVFVVITTSAVVQSVYLDSRTVCSLGIVASFITPYLVQTPASPLVPLFLYLGFINVGVWALVHVKPWPLQLYLTLVGTIVLYQGANPQPGDPADFTPATTFLTTMLVTYSGANVLWPKLKREYFDRILPTLPLAGILYYTGTYELLDPLYPEMMGEFTAGLSGYFLLLGAGTRWWEDSHPVRHWAGSTGLLFLLVAIPVEFNGAWVTLLWSGLAVLLAVAGTVRTSRWLTYVSLPPFVLAGVHWTAVHLFQEFPKETLADLFLNERFLTGVCLSATLFAAYSLIDSWGESETWLYLVGDLYLGIGWLVLFVLVPVNFRGSWITLLWIGLSIATVVVGVGQSRDDLLALSLVPFACGVGQWWLYDQAIDPSGQSLWELWTARRLLTGLSVVAACYVGRYFLRQLSEITAVPDFVRWVFRLTAYGMLFLLIPIHFPGSWVTCLWLVLSVGFVVSARFRDLQLWTFKGMFPLLGSSIHWFYYDYTVEPVSKQVVDLFTAHRLWTGLAVVATWYVCGTVVRTIGSSSGDWSGWKRVFYGGGTVMLFLLIPYHFHGVWIFSLWLALGAVYTVLAWYGEKMSVFLGGTLFITGSVARWFSYEMDVLPGGSGLIDLLFSERFLTAVSLAAVLYLNDWLVTLWMDDEENILFTRISYRFLASLMLFVVLQVHFPARWIATIILAGSVVFAGLGTYLAQRSWLLVAAVYLVSGTGRWFTYDFVHFPAELSAFELFLNHRFLTGAILVSVWFAWSFSSEYWDELVKGKFDPSTVLFSISHLLTLGLLTIESSTYFQMRAALAEARTLGEGALRSFEYMRLLSYSLIWGGYGLLLLILGFFRVSRRLRLTALAVLIVTVGKVFIIDIQELSQIYRIASFFFLGLSLLGISFLYHRFRDRISRFLTAEAEGI